MMISYWDEYINKYWFCIILVFEWWLVDPATSSNSFCFCTQFFKAFFPTKELIL